MYKLLYLTGLFWFCLQASYAQQNSENLVPNPSFEQISDCDLYFEEFHKVAHWKSYNFTPDIFHTCSHLTFLSTPSNVFDFQQPAEGKGYAGIMTYHVEYPNEVIGVKLKQPLQVGKHYRLSFKVSRAKTHARYASDNLGMLLTNSPDKAVYAGKAHMIMDEIIEESENWVQISSVVRADEAYQYVMIGNFFTEEYTRLRQMSEGNFETAYYFVDEVSVQLTTDLPTLVRTPTRIGKSNVTVSNTPLNGSVYALSGKVIDAITKEPLSSKIELVVPLTTKKEHLETHYTDGSYAFTGIENPDRFFMKVSARNYYPQTHIVTISREEPRAQKNIYLYPLKSGVNVYLKSVEFEGGTEQLTPEAINELQHFAQVMRDNPLMEIELQSITDTDAPDAMALAQKRAKSVQDYLAIAGKIDRRRLKTVSLQQTQANSEVGNASEEVRKPDRIEFKVLN
ncbi:MAG: OmpA family protein [Bacteroidetes bacterium]|nr:MAG: OmpA family protein [Bacteroidota bacterium]